MGWGVRGTRAQSWDAYGWRDRGAVSVNVDEDEDAWIGVQTDVWYGRSVDGMCVCLIVRF